MFSTDLHQPPRINLFVLSLWGWRELISHLLDSDPWGWVPLGATADPHVHTEGL